MAAGTLASPGTEYGPCTDDCEHRDCAYTRWQAASLCTICGKPIGYDTRYYRDAPADEGTRDQYSMKFCHALCFEESIDG